ncbi:MAG: GTPase Era [Myxococcota bacterium]|nr:GTPase Era [Myxococcota bacterium]
MAQPRVRDPEKKQPTAVPPRAGRCVIAGRPNVGKSTLLNALLGQKLAIVAPRPGTTRSVLLGVFDAELEGSRTQIAFLDTPGLEVPKTVLGRVLVEEAQGALEQGDVFLLLLDATEVVKKRALPDADARILELMRPLGKPVIVALNKVDKIKDKTLLFPALQVIHDAFDFAAILPISALRKSNLEPLLREIRERVPAGLLWEEDVLTDRPERFFAAELVREAILMHTRQEVPHGVAVQVDDWVDEGTLVRVGVTIIVARDSHKGILIGARGEMLKQIGTEAREAMEAMLGRKVFLRSFVKVIPGWTEDPQKVRRLTRDGGLE